VRYDLPEPAPLVMREFIWGKPLATLEKPAQSEEWDRMTEIPHPEID
jgi:hypothetical protein